MCTVWFVTVPSTEYSHLLSGSRAIFVSFFLLRPLRCSPSPAPTRGDRLSSIVSATPIVASTLLVLIAPLQCGILKRPLFSEFLLAISLSSHPVCCCSQPHWTQAQLRAFAASSLIAGRFEINRSERTHKPTRLLTGTRSGQPLSLPLVSIPGRLGKLLIVSSLASYWSVRSESSRRGFSSFFISFSN